MGFDASNTAQSKIILFTKISRLNGFVTNLLVKCNNQVRHLFQAYLIPEWLSDSITNFWEETNDCMIKRKEKYW